MFIVLERIEQDNGIERGIVGHGKVLGKGYKRRC